MGFGVCEITEGKPRASVLADRLKAAANYQNASLKVWDGGMPALHNMFFAEIEPNDPNGISERTTFLIKQQLREAFRTPSFGDEIRHYVCGHISGGNRVGSKIFVSRPYPHGNGQRIRVYGWFPRSVPDKAARFVGGNATALSALRKPAINAIHSTLDAKHKIIKDTWREMGAPGRDTAVAQGPIIFYLQLAGYLKVAHP